MWKQKDGGIAIIISAQKRQKQKYKRYWGKKQWTLVMMENYREEKKNRRYKNLLHQNNFEERWEKIFS